MTIPTVRSRALGSAIPAAYGHYQLRSNADQAEHIDHENQKRQMGEKAVERRMSAVPMIQPTIRVRRSALSPKCTNTSNPLQYPSCVATEITLVSAALE
jgi:hypothetical protein